MRRRAMYRWKSFWLGVLMLCFLGWAWVRSMTWIDEVNWQRADRTTGLADGHGVAVWQVHGKVSVSWNSYDPFKDEGVSHWSELVEGVFGLDGTRSEVVWFEPDESVVNDEGADPFAKSGPDGSDPFATGTDARLADPSAPYEVYARTGYPCIVVFPKAMVMEGSEVSVAHWVLWLGCFLVWMGWLGWRWRRERRADLTEMKMETEVSR